MLAGLALVYVLLLPGQDQQRTINVDDSGIALAFQKADGSETDNNLDMSDSAGLVINLKVRTARVFSPTLKMVLS